MLPTILSKLGYILHKYHIRPVANKLIKSFSLGSVLYSYLIFLTKFLKQSWAQGEFKLDSSKYWIEDVNVMLDGLNFKGLWVLPAAAPISLHYPLSHDYTFLKP